MVNKLKQEKLV